MERKTNATIEREIVEQFYSQPLRFEFGTYSLELPNGATITAQLATRSRPGGTTWTIHCGRHRFSIQLSATGTPADLAPFLSYVTKTQIKTNAIAINGIEGVTYGALSEQERIDWHLKRGELMILISLSGPALRSSEEHALHERFISSIQHIPTT